LEKPALRALSCGGQKWADDDDAWRFALSVRMRWLFASLLRTHELPERVRNGHEDNAASCVLDQLTSDLCGVGVMHSTQCESTTHAAPLNVIDHVHPLFTGWWPHFNTGASSRPLSLYRFFPNHDSNI